MASALPGLATLAGLNAKGAFRRPRVPVEGEEDYSVSFST